MKNNGLVLRASHLRKEFGKKVAVEDASLEVHQGEIMGLLGPNGAGKTTCFYMIVGFITPTSGTIYLGSEDLSKLPMYKRARYGIAYLPQEASVFRRLTVRDNVMAVLEARKDLDPASRKEKLESLLWELGIEDQATQMAYTLSGGERRRTEIARALANDPSFLLLDEPFAGIDPRAVHEIKMIIEELSKKDIGILITDHNVRDTLEITERATIIHKGEILLTGTREEVVASEDVKEIYLGKHFKM
jgi:lipopolysaccharide export system ATP-binding protein